MNPKNRRLRRSVVAIGISLLGIGVATANLVLTAPAPAKAAENSHNLMINLPSGVGSIRIAGINDEEGVGICLPGPLPKGWYNTRQEAQNGVDLFVIVHSSTDCTGAPFQNIKGKVPFNDGLDDYWLQ